MRERLLLAFFLPRRPIWTTSSRAIVTTRGKRPRELLHKCRYYNVNSFLNDRVDCALAILDECVESRKTIFMLRRLVDQGGKINTAEQHKYINESYIMYHYSVYNNVLSFSVSRPFSRKS